MKPTLLLVLALLGNAFASSTFVPGGFANSDGNSNSISPLSVGSYYLNGGAQGSGQMQELYDASGFAALGSTLTISQVAFRNAAGDSPLGNDPLLGDVEVYMDTTSQTINGISSSFAANENSPVLVYSGPLQFNLPYDGGDPACFCYTIPFTIPYVYIPADGNLLLDIVILQGNNPGNSSLPSLDFDRGGTTAMSVDVDYSSSSDTTGGTETDSGWTTQFTYDVGATNATPEPGSFVLVGAGFVGLKYLRKRAAR